MIEFFSMGMLWLCVLSGILGCMVLVLVSIWKRCVEFWVCDLVGVFDDVDEVDD